MRSVATALFVLVGCGGALAQTAPLPFIAGNGLVNVLVEIDGSVKVWGNPAALDPSPPLGTGLKASAQPEVKAPIALPGVEDVVGAAVGVDHVLLVKRDGTVLAWGENDSCQLGNGTDKKSLVPIPVPTLRHVVQVGAGYGSSAALLSDGTVWVWGNTGQKDCTRVPTKVDGVTNAKRLAFSGDSALILKDDGTVWGWGLNKWGELCDGTTERRTAPVQARGVASAVDVALDEDALIILADGTIRMCGKNDDGSLGDPGRASQHLTPFQVPGVTGVKAARMDAGVVYVQLVDGTLRAWGNGWYGALGDGHGDASSSRPRAPLGLGPVLVHYLSHNTSYAIKADGTVMEWGGLLAPPGSKTQFLLTPTPASFTVKVGR